MFLIESKHCKICGEVKPLYAFAKNKGMKKDGHINHCKACVSKYKAQHRLKNLEKLRQNDREREKTTDRKNWRKEQFKKYLSKYPDKHPARVAINNAIRDGRLMRMLCFMCGKKAEAHHVSYDLPLDVSWLCREHHLQVHMEFNHANS